MNALLESVCYLTKEVIKGDVSNFIAVKLYIHTCVYTVYICTYGVIYFEEIDFDTTNSWRLHTYVCKLVTHRLFYLPKVVDIDFVMILRDKVGSDLVTHSHALGSIYQ